MDKRILKRNDTGKAVRALARLLVERGHLKEPSNIFDRTLMHAVEEFQARHVDERGCPLVVDGIVGPMTWWALEHPDNTDILSQPVADPLTRMPPV
ncbi:MAG: peptidoglycan-binding protein, partial [Verrucomicrobia bacterium]